MKKKGYLCLVLHAHLPFVHHPEYPEFLEEDWFFEAVSETYVPLLDVFDGLAADGVDFRLTMSISPPLCEMLANDLLRRRYLRHLHKLIDLATKEVERTGTDAAFHKAALMYRDHFERVRYVFEDKYRGNILTGFKNLQDAGVLEIVSVPATHGYLPLMISEAAKRAQVQIAGRNYEKHFSRQPRGMWLSECAYAEGIDALLKEAGFEFFFLDAHGILYGVPRPKFGVYAPVYTPAGVAGFGRDIESSKQVWSSQEGYPGDFNYREFYRDLGYDGHYDYVRPYLHGDGVRRNIGIKYFKITGNVELHEKRPYDPGAAREKAAEHAGNFMFNRQQQVRYLRDSLGRKPVVVSPYDAELFGHWWFEGPDFLNFLFRKIRYDQDDIALITPSEYLELYPENQMVRPSPSSWGDKGYNEVWLNGSNDWIYRHLHNAETKMIELAQRFPRAQGTLRRALNQTARELLLAQSSDWAFIMTTGTAPSYAEKRTRNHISRFLGLYRQITESRIEEEWLARIEHLDPIFQEIDYTVYG